MNAAIDDLTRRARGDLADITVAEAMHAGVVTCTLDTSLREVARLMASRRIHCIVARDGEDARGALWGIVSDLDLVAAASAGQVDGRTAAGIAVTPVLTVAAGETLERAAQLMAEHAVAHLVVVGATDGDPVGVLSTLDIARTLTRTARA
jgi:CBS domain-containing protein